MGDGDEVLSVEWESDPGDWIYWYEGSRLGPCSGRTYAEYYIKSAGSACEALVEDNEWSPQYGGGKIEYHNTKRKREPSVSAPVYPILRQPEPNNVPSNATKSGCSGQKRTMPMIFAYDGPDTWALQFQNLSQLESYERNPPENVSAHLIFFNSFDA